MNLVCLADYRLSPKAVDLSIPGSAHHERKRQGGLHEPPSFFFSLNLNVKYVEVNTSVRGNTACFVIVFHNHTHSGTVLSMLNTCLLSE